MNHKLLLIPLIGALVAVLLVNYVSKLAPKNPDPTTDQSESRYGKSTFLTVASISVVISWLSIIGVLFSLFLFIIGLSILFFVFWVIVLVASSCCYFAICPFLKCDNCGRVLTFQWTRESPPFAQKIWGMDGWASIILQVLLSRKFTCMYCGKHYSII